MATNNKMLNNREELTFDLQKANDDMYSLKNRKAMSERAAHALDKQRRAKRQQDLDDYAAQQFIHSAMGWLGVIFAITVIVMVLLHFSGIKLWG